MPLPFCDSSAGALWVFWPYIQLSLSLSLSFSLFLFLSLSLCLSLSLPFLLFLSFSAASWTVYAALTRLHPSRPLPPLLFCKSLLRNTEILASAHNCLYRAPLKGTFFKTREGERGGRGRPRTIVKPLWRRGVWSSKDGLRDPGGIKPEFYPGLLYKFTIAKLLLYAKGRSAKVSRQQPSDGDCNILEIISNLCLCIKTFEIQNYTIPKQV